MELEPESVMLTSDLMTESILTLKQMDANVKQHHRTIAQNIIGEVNRLFAQLRHQEIVAYQVALDDTVGKIIQHAEKCRGLNERALRLAVIEFCASRWFHAKKDAMDRTEYLVSAADGDDGIQVSIMTYLGSKVNVVATIQFDEEFSKQIITEDAVQTFEWEQQSIWFEKQAEMERHANYEQELIRSAMEEECSDDDYELIG